MDLIRHNGRQTALSRIQLDRVKYSPVYDLRVKGTADVVRYAHVIRPPDVLGGILTGNHDDRNIIDPVTGIHHIQHAETVHAGHDDIQQHKGNAGAILLQRFQTCLTGGRFHNGKILAQHLCQQRPVEFRIVHNEDQLLADLFLLLQLCDLRSDPGLILLCHHRILPILGLVHEPVCPLHSFLHRVVCLKDTADAGCQLDLIEILHLGPADLLMDLLQLLVKMFRRHIR